MNFRSYNHFLEFPIINRRFVPGMLDTRRTRRVPGRVFRGDSRGCRAVSEWSLGLGHAAQPEASGEISLGIRVRNAFGTSGRYSGLSRGESRDTWRLGGLPEEGFSLGTRKHVACSEGRSGRSLGAASKGLRGSFRLALRDTWHVPKERPKKASGETFGLTFGSRGAFRRKDRRVCFEGVSKGLSGRWLPGQVALSEGRSGRVFGGSFEGAFGRASERGRGL